MLGSSNTADNAAFSSIAADIIKILCEVKKTYINSQCHLLNEYEPIEMLWVLLNIAKKYDLSTDFIKNIDIKKISLDYLIEKVMHIK